MQKASSEILKRLPSWYVELLEMAKEARRKMKRRKSLGMGGEISEP